MSKKIKKYAFFIATFKQKILPSSLLLLTIFQCSHAAQLPLIEQTKLFQQDSKQELWQDLALNPLNKKQFFIHTKSGKVYLTNKNKFPTTPIFNLKTYYPKLINFNNFTLHPSFSFSSQENFLSFYTSHLEPVDKKQKTKRVIETSIKEVLPYEIVVAKWQFNQKDDLSLSVAKPKEILRIPALSANDKIVQMAFNPHIKSWQNDFSLLFIALSFNEKLANSALYSGAILRINPKNFGLLSYTIPAGNPFNKTKSIPNEVIITGSQQLRSFTWLKNSVGNLLASHSYQQKELLSQIDHGSDWRVDKKTPSLLELSNSTGIDNSVIYRGSAMPSLRNHLLSLQWNKQWQLNAIKTTTPYTNEVIARLDSTIFNKHSNITLYSDAQGELLLLDKNNHSLIKITASIENNTNTSQLLLESKKQSEQQLTKLLIWLLAIGVIIAIIYKISFGDKWGKAKGFLKKHYAKFSLDATKNKVLLFNRHQEVAEQFILVRDIIKSEILLNEQLISTVDASNEHGFSHEDEQVILTNFTKEKRDKMVTAKVRKVELLLTDNNKHTFSICLYMREGNQRLTKAKYNEVIKDVIDWTWFIAQKINPKRTQKRIIRVDVPVAAEPTVQITRPSQSQPIKATVDTLEPIQLASEKKEDMFTTDSTQKTDQIAGHQSDVDLINALDKLAKLKQQGLLTDTEFEEAKNKILNNLTNS